MKDRFNKVESGNTEITRFKEETLQLLNDQTIKIRSLNGQIHSQLQQLQIKEEQFKFYKETIAQLQSQNQKLLIQKNTLEIKLKNIVRQISEYNANVVQIIHQQNKRLQEQTDCQNQQINQLKAKIRDTQIQFQQQTLTLQSFKGQNTSNVQKVASLYKELNGINVQNQRLKLANQNKQDQIKVLSKKLCEKDQVFEKLQFQYITVNKQMGNLMQKHTESVKQNQKKLKQSLSNMIDKRTVQQFQKLIQRQQKKMNQLKLYVSAKQIERQQLKRANLILRQQNIKFKHQVQLKYKEVELDLQNLLRSTQLGRKIIQFQSASSQTFYKIYDKFNENHCKNLQLQIQTEKLKQQIQKQAHRLRITNQQLAVKQQECFLLKNKNLQQIQSLQSQYQGKLLILSIKIKSEEESLRQLSKKEEQSIRQNEDSLRNLQKLQKQFQQYKTASTNTINQLQKQNYSVMNQLQQVLALCQQNLNSKSILDKIKYVLNSLLMSIWYLQNLIVSKKQTNMRIFYPFVQYYFHAHPIISISQDRIQSKSIKTKQKFVLRQQSQKSIAFEFEQKKVKTNRFRICAKAIIAVIKIKNNFQNKNSIGVYNHVQKAIKTRQKLQNTQQLLDNILQHCLQSQDDLTTTRNILKMTEKVYKWKNIPETLKLNLNIKNDLQILRLQKEKIQSKQSKQS